MAKDVDFPSKVFIVCVPWSLKSLTTTIYPLKLVFVLGTNKKERKKKWMNEKSKSTLRDYCRSICMYLNSIMFKENFSQTAGYVLWVCCTIALLSLNSPPMRPKSIAFLSYRTWPSTTLILACTFFSSIYIIVDQDQIIYILIW